MTSAQLSIAAQELFGRLGYGATSIDAVAAAAGVTKGAVYHHFQGKAALFRAAFVHEQEQIAVRLERAASEEPDSWAALRRGCRTFLEHCLDPGFQRIVMLDGPAALGWETVREIESGHLLRVLAAGMRAAAADGLLVEGDLEVRCRMIFGGLCEAGMLLARSKNPADQLPAILVEAERLLSAAVRDPRAQNG